MFKLQHSNTPILQHSKAHGYVPDVQLILAAMDLSSYKTYWLRMSAIWMFGVWVILQFIVAGQQVAGISNVSGGAHLGGALAGVFVWLVWRLNHGKRYASEGGFAK
jgi:membrane associated rhomboid family serine protease